MNIDTLNCLDLNEEAIIKKNRITSSNRRNIINLGITEDTKIKCLFRSPLGDPTAYLVKNIIIAIREEDSKYIEILRINNGAH